MSNKSVTAAREIEQIIKKAESISKTTETRLNNVVQLFNNINVHVDDLAVRMEMITDSIGEINRSKVDTLNSIESISAVSEETSAASEEVDATAQQQLEVVTKLNEAAKALGRDVTELENAIVIFKTK